MNKINSNNNVTALANDKRKKIIAPIPLSTMAGQPTENIAKSFLKSFAGVCLQGVVIVLACVIFTAYAASMPQMNTSYEPLKMVWIYVVDNIS